MRVLLVHNYYQRAGGEDHVFADERDMLQSNGHEVVSFTLHNDSIKSSGPADAARRALWNGDTYRQVRALLRESRASVMHCHNTFPLVSPSVYYAARAEGVPVVQTLHNYRLLCPAALFYRAGGPCESCLGSAVPWRGVLHGCYRGSRAATAAVGAAMVGHRAAGTWTRQVNVYIAPSEFTKRKLVEGGFLADMIAVKPHFVLKDPGVGSGDGGYGLFVGRLSPEKGVKTLLAAWQRIRCAVPLRIVGDGPDASDVAAAATQSPNISWLGPQSQDSVAALVGRATFLVVPSESYETFGRVVAEAFAAGTPVVASDIGALAELVDHGRTGFLFTAGDSEALSRQVELLLSDEIALHEMRRQARAEFERRFTMVRNYELLRAIYERVQMRVRVAHPRGDAGKELAAR